MPSDYYLLIKGIKGESQAADMTDNIDLESWSWGASNPASLGGKGLAAGQTIIERLYVQLCAGSRQPNDDRKPDERDAHRQCYIHRPQDRRRRETL